MPPNLLSTPKLSKAPQHNPYDKFTQDEFDAWIGGITSALKRALGQEDEVVSPPETNSQYLEESHSSDEAEVERLVEFTGESSEEEAQASFSYPTARRVSKGKARDPRDGPGFGRGDQSEPIVIGSDSEEEEEEDDDGEGEGDEVIEEWDSQSEEDDENLDVDWTEAESSVQAQIRRDQQIAVELAEEDDEENEEEEEDGEEKGGLKGDEQHGGDDENDYEVPSPRQTSSPVLVVDSDEEDEVHAMAFQSRAPDEMEFAVAWFDEDDTTLSMSTSRVGPPRYRAKQQLPVSPMETQDIDAENYEDIQPLENDTSFPPHDTIPPANEEMSVELPNPWDGPEVYAEDYYSSGDIRKSPNLTADSLGMEHEETHEMQQSLVSEEPPPLEQQHSAERHNKAPEVQDVILLGVDDVDKVQPLSEDTSFPPKITEDNYFQSHHQPIEIPDPWIGPKTYAEDFYSGGDVRPLQRGTLDPHRLGNDDGSVISSPPPQHDVLQPQEEVNHFDKIHRGQEQLPFAVADASTNSAYEPSHFDYTVELPRPWDEPIHYEEDFSAEVEVEIKFPPPTVANQSGTCDNDDTPIIMDSANETRPMRPQDIIAGTSSDDVVKLAQEHSENGHESAERVLNHAELLATSDPKGLSGQSLPAYAKDLDILYEDIVVTGESQHPVHDQSQDDVPVLEWINDSAFIRNMPASIAAIRQSDFDAFNSESTRVDSNEEIVEEIAENPKEGINVQPPRLPTVEESIEKTVEAVGQVPNEDHPEAGLQNTSETSEVGALPPTSLGSSGRIEDALPDKHDQEPEISSLPTFVRETETGEFDRFGVDNDFVFEDDLVATPTEEVKETGVKVDAGTDEIPLDPDAAPEVLCETLTIVEHIEVLDKDSATRVNAVSEGSNLEIKPITISADSDNSGVTMAELELTVAPSAIPTVTEGLQSIGGDAHTSASVDADELDSQIAPASQDNSLHASKNLTVHTTLTSMSQSQSLDALDSTIENSVDLPEPLQTTSGPALDLTIVPPAPETSQTETTPRKQTIYDSVIAQGPISVDSDMILAPLDQQKVQPTSSLSSFPSPVLSPYPRPYSMNVVMRKASEPVLFADPYPANLSTPDDTNSGYAMSYEQIIRQNGLPSPSDVPEGSTAGRNVVNAVNGQTQNQISVADNPARDTCVQPNDEAPPFQQDDSTAVELANNADLISAKPVVTALVSSPMSRSSVADNATGDIYIQSSEETSILQQYDSTKVKLANDADLTLAKPVAPVLSSSTTSKDVDKSLELSGLSEHTSTVSELAANGDGIENMAQQSSPLSSPAVVECTNGASATRVRSPPLEDDLPSILIIKKVHADDHTPVKPKAGRSQKRKRSSSVTMSSPLPRAGSSKKSEKNQAALCLPTKSRASNRKAPKIEKGKGKEVGVPPTSKGSFDTRSISSRSSSDASAARRILEPSSRSTSRASSIASTAPSDNSMNIAQSPTLGRGGSFRQQLPPPPPPPVPLLHRHHHNRPQPSRSVPTQRASLSARQPDPASAESSTSKQSSSSLHRHPTYSSSPVTRSNCRYHKISIPLDDESDEEGSGDEDVKLVYFLVPGCSLGNKELNRDEKIVDHGDAQPSDGLLMTSDLDAYAFNAPLLSVLRLLVGVDMLREGEIYYLPLPGSDWVPRKVRDTSIKAHQASAEHGPSPRRNSTISTSSINAPSNGSASISAPFRPMKPLSVISQTSSELTEVEDSPQLKRFKSSPVQEADNVREMVPGSDSRSRKSKHLGQDAVEYRPESQEEGEDLEEQAIRRARLNKGTKQGLKRSRTSDMIREPEDGQKLKKQKTGPDLRTTLG